MSTSTDALLVYGFDLCGGEYAWNVREADDAGELPPRPWYNPFHQASATDFYEAAGRHLKASPECADVSIEVYCSAPVPMYLLSAHTITVRRGGCEPLHPSTLAALAQNNSLDAKLAAAVRHLDLTPCQPAPAWLLAPYWSGP